MKKKISDKAGHFALCNSHFVELSWNLSFKIKVTLREAYLKKSLGSFLIWNHTKSK